MSAARAGIDSPCMSYTVVLLRFDMEVTSADVCY